jgi:hypothetical protein
LKQITIASSIGMSLASLALGNVFPRKLRDNAMQTHHKMLKSFAPTGQKSEIPVVANLPRAGRRFAR